MNPLRTTAVLVFRVLALFSGASAIAGLITPILGALDDWRILIVYGAPVLVLIAAVILWRYAGWFANRTVASGENTETSVTDGQFTDAVAVAVCVVGLVLIGFFLWNLVLLAYTAVEYAKWSGEEFAFARDYILGIIHDSLVCAIEFGAGLILVLAARRVARAMTWLRPNRAETDVQTNSGPRI